MMARYFYGKCGKKPCVILALFCVTSAFSERVRRYFSVILRYFEIHGFSAIYLNDPPEGGFHLHGD